ncbi:MAG: MBL fold metallo-hydrolase [Acidimicrobiia bacterium]|nr:MBL fold metallo-hydrolase [Acidimicrobiia bacterium]
MKEKEMNPTVTVLGSGCPIPTLERSGPAFALDIGTDISMIDCGPGALKQMMVAGLDVARSTKVFITHHHSDHTFDLGQFALGGWTLGRRALHIYGPSGTERIAHLWFEEMLGADIAYRAGLGRPTGGLIDIGSTDCGPGHIFENDEMTVTAAHGVHTTEDLAYRFDVGGRSIVFTGDTAPTDDIADLARGADVLFHESNLVPTARDAYAKTEGGLAVWESLQDHHTPPEKAGEIAQKAGVRQLVLIHFLPGADPRVAEELASSTFDGPVVAAEDLMRVEVGDEIMIHR